MTLRKTYELASFKQLDDGPGRFEAIVSVFGSVDLQGDRVMPGAFQKSLKKWRGSGAPVPIVWSHQWLEPDAYIGEADPSEIQEISMPIGEKGTGGLLVRGKLDINKPFAAQVWDLLKSRRIKEWSWSYDVDREKMANDGANNLEEVSLIEAGPCLKGAHPDTYTISAKSAMEAELKEASEAQRSLTHFIDLIKTVDDPEIASLLSKTMMSGTTKKEVRRFHVEPRIAFDGKNYDLEKGDVFACISNTTGDAVDYHESEAEAKVHVKRLEAGDHDSLRDDDLRKALGLEPVVLLPPKADEPDDAKDDEPDDEKTGSKPWHIEERDGQFCVIKDADGSVAGCSDTRDEAEAHMRALYASEKTTEPDGVKWDGAAAMATCKTASDFRSIAFERANDSDPDTAAHWALPHHPRPGAEADDGGVSAAFAALHGARGGKPSLKNPSAAESHLKGHGAGSDDGKTADELHEEALEIDEAKYITTTTTATAVPISYNVTTDGNDTTTWTISVPGGEKVGRVIGQKAAAALKSRLGDAVDAFVKEINGQAEPTDEPPKTDDPSETKTDDEPDTKTETPTEWLEGLLND